MRAPADLWNLPPSVTLSATVTKWGHELERLGNVIALGRDRELGCSAVTLDISGLEYLLFGVPMRAFGEYAKAPEQPQDIHQGGSEG